MIIGQSWNTIRYVDCFSGPWQEADEELQDTYIGISLEIMPKCREGLLATGKNVSFKALFIEKDVNSHKKLVSYLNGHNHPGIETEAKNGEFLFLRGTPEGEINMNLVRADES